MMSQRVADQSSPTPWLTWFLSPSCSAANLATASLNLATVFCQKRPVENLVTIPGFIGDLGDQCICTLETRKDKEKCSLAVLLFSEKRVLHLTHIAMVTSSSKILRIYGQTKILWNKVLKTKSWVSLTETGQTCLSRNHQQCTIKHYGILIYISRKRQSYSTILFS